VSSYDSVNFTIRPNKNVERKLVFEALRTLNPPFAIHSYRYIGLGGIWFSDFILAHRILRIDRMHSIETQPTAAERARFNRPYATVEVSAGLTTEVLPTLALGAERAIVWLDYDTSLRGPVLKDIPILTETLPPGSLILLTVNADPRSLGKTFEERSTTLAQYAAGYYDEPLPNSFFNAIPSGFPARLAEIILDNLPRDNEQRTGLSFVPMFNFYYADNVAMITVGGMIVDGNTRDMLGQTHFSAQLGVGNGQQFAIDLPMLTRREKLCLDRLLPTEPPLEEQRLIASQSGSAAVKKERLMLRPAEVSAYNRFYRYYPMYSETDP